VRSTHPQLTKCAIPFFDHSIPLTPRIIQRHSLPGCFYRDSDFCFLDDNTGTFHTLSGCHYVSIQDAEGDYFDLRLVPERYTGYSGKDAQRVWRSIYEENCFGLSELSLMTSKSPALVSLPDTMIEVLHEDGQESDSHCLEKRVYYKVISGEGYLCSLSILLIILGLHASISTHICHDYLNQTAEEWVGPLPCLCSALAHQILKAT